MEGRQQIQDHVRLVQSGCAFEQDQHLVAGEGAAQKDTLCRRQDVRGAPAQHPHGLVGGEAVAAIQHGDRAAQGQLGGQRGDLLAGRGRGAEYDQVVGFEKRRKVHVPTIAISA